MDSSTQKIVPLFAGHTYKPMLVLKGRRFDDIITIKKQ